MTGPRYCPLCDGVLGSTDYCPACQQHLADGTRAVLALLDWARKVSPRRPIIEAEWVQAALDQGRWDESMLGEHRKHIV